MTEKKRIAIYTQDAKLGNEVKGATRYVYLATLLHEHGYDVDFITSGFQHWEKRQRDVEHFDAGTDAYAIRFIEEPFYPKNMCPQRIWAHHVVAKRVSEYFDEHHDYDLIYCQIPPNDVAREIGKAAQKFNIPFVVDVNDLWPEAFRVAFDVPVLSDILFAPFYRQAKAVYQMADAVVGTSDEYRERGLRDARAGIPSETVYVGNQLCEFDAGIAAHASQIDKSAGDIWVSYARAMTWRHWSGPWRWCRKFTPRLSCKSWAMVQSATILRPQRILAVPRSCSMAICLIAKWLHGFPRAT